MKARAGETTTRPERRATARRDVPRRIRSDQLMGEARELLIEHAGCEYRLRVTSQNKLILTK